jgi:biopolymer transport protein ExbD
MAIRAVREVPTMGEINMTPLIDVMLVLLVMFIITIPLQTHAVKMDLPQDCPNCPFVDSVKNKIVVTNDGAVLWNGSPVTQDELVYNLSASARMDPQPELHLQPESEARYEIVNEVFVAANRAKVKRMGFVGNEIYGSF